jgi:dipeptidyl aminopeptidase/acylaminoacyl peptidase
MGRAWVKRLVVIGIAVLFTAVPQLGVCASEGIQVEEAVYQSQVKKAEVKAVLYKPAKMEGRLPTILVLPGGKGDVVPYEFLSKPLAEAGYVVMAIYYRHWGVSGYDDVDARSALDFLVAKPFVDPNRIAIVGHSRGGMSGLRVIATDSRVKCMVALEPPTDNEQVLKGIEKHSPIFWKAVFQPMVSAAPEGAPALVNAIEYTDRIKVPIYMVAGLFDMIVPPHMPKAMAKALEESGNKHVEFEILPIGHFLSMTSPKLLKLVASKVQLWLDKNL